MEYEKRTPHVGEIWSNHDSVFEITDETEEKFEIYCPQDKSSGWIHRTTVSKPVTWNKWEFVRYAPSALIPEPVSPEPQESAQEIIEI